MQKEFIEVDRVLSNKVTKENVATERECVDISLIKTFRGWHKGEKDRAIKGEMTLIILVPDEKTSEEDKSIDKSHSMIIEESFSSFRDRIGTKVVVRKIE